MLAIIFLCSTLLAQTSGAAGPDKAPPSFDKVQDSIAAWFAKQPDYRPGDLISRSQAKAVLQIAADMGAEVSETDKLLLAVLDDQEFLVTRLRTQAGRVLMRRVAALPNGYDSLDRLSRIPSGRRLVEDVIRGPRGDELIKYLTTTPGGKNMGAQLSRVPNGNDFNKPTGRIYTASDLIAAIKTRYPAAKPATASGGRS